VPEYLYEELKQVAARESRTVASVVSELLHFALREQRPAWIPDEHLRLFNDRARRALALAREEARDFDHSYLGTEHLLLGLLREDEGAAARFLTGQGVEIETVRDALVRIVGRGDKPASGDPEYAPRARRVLALAVDEARRLGHAQVGTAHVLLGVAREGRGIAAGILERLGLDLEQLRQRGLPGASEVD
jgi:ATP-dependent Clp protease ATP-binding subunit ClpC